MRKFYRLLDKKNKSLTKNPMYPASDLLESIGLILRQLREEGDGLRRAGVVLLAERKIPVDVFPHSSSEKNTLKKYN